MRLAAAAVLLLLQAKENPQFDAWKGFAAGSWVKLRVETIEDGEKTISEETETLVRAAADNVVIERKSTTQFGGQPFTSTDKEEIPQTTTAILKIEKSDDEAVEISGKKMTCRVVIVTRKPVDSSGESRHKLWMHADVPGGVVRSETTSLRTNRVTGTALALGWEKK